MKNLIRATVAVLAVAIAAPAFAGGITVAEDGDKKLKFESLFFLNTTANTTKVNGAKTAESTGLAVDRAYFTLKYSFDKNWSMRFTTDMESNQVGSGLGKTQNIYLKYAYLQGKLAGDAAVLRLGQSHTPWIDYEQHLWGHRYVAKVTSDYYKFDDSSDLGIGLKGDVADGMVKYWVTETTGAGYGNKAGSTKGQDLNVRLGVYPIEGLTLDAQFRDGYRGKKTFAAPNQNKETLNQFMATYGMGKTFRVGANYLTRKIANTSKDDGYSVWATGNFGSGFGAFARYDAINNKNSAGTKLGKSTRTVAGVEYSVIKGVTFSLALEEGKVDNTASAGNVTKTSRMGLFTQVKL